MVLFLFPFWFISLHSVLYPLITLMLLLLLLLLTFVP